MNNAAPEGRNSIVPGFIVPPLRGWCGFTAWYPRLTPWATDLPPLCG